MITGNVSGPCMSGFYYVLALPQTNLYLLVIEDWLAYKSDFFYNFHCRITRRSEVKSTVCERTDIAFLETSLENEILNIIF